MENKTPRCRFSQTHINTLMGPDWDYEMYLTGCYFGQEYVPQVLCLKFLDTHDCEHVTYSLHICKKNNNTLSIYLIFNFYGTTYCMYLPG